jgi:hypothetical protein
MTAAGTMARSYWRVRTRALVATLAGGLLVVGVVLVAGPVGGGGTTPPPASPSPPSLPGWSASPQLDHEDDYDAPAEDLIGHADHLDFDRLPPATRRELEAMLAERQSVASDLWAAYGRTLFGEDAPELQARTSRLDAYELAYVLVAVRADQLATALTAEGDLQAAVARTGPDHPAVAVALDDDCVTVTYADDPYQRAFGVRPSSTSAGELLDRLERRVRVAAAGGPACDGTPVAFSPAVHAALSD